MAFSVEIIIIGNAFAYVQALKKGLTCVNSFASYNFVKYSYYNHFTDEEIETQKTWETFPCQQN